MLRQFVGNSNEIVLKSGNSYPFNYNLFFNDVDEEDLTISIPGDIPEGLTLTQNGNCLATLSGDLQEAGEYVVTINVEDEANQITQQTFTLHAVGDGYKTDFTNYQETTNGDNSPVITSSGYEIVYKNGDSYPCNHELYFNDADEDVLTISAIDDLPEGLTLTQNGNCAAVVNGNLQESGKYTFTVELTDGTNNTQQLVIIHAIGDDYNTDKTNEDKPTDSHAPYFSTLGDATLFVGELYSYKIIANDIDEDNISFQYDNTQLSGVLDLVESTTEVATATLSGAINSPGVHTIQVGITDGTNTTYQDITITVLSDNSAPVITSLSAPTSVNVNETYSYALTATDSDGDNITYSVEGELSSVLSVENLVNNNGTATATLTGVITEAKSYDVTLKAEDTHGGTDSYTFTLEVIQPNRPPSITSRTAPTSVNVNETYSYALTATDSDGDNITYTVEGELSSVLSVENLVNNNGTATATLTGVITEAKSYDVTLKAEDTHGGTDSYTFTLEVIQPNRAPSITSLSAPTIVNVNETYSYALTATDADGDNITYTVEGELSSVLSVENLVNNNGTATATLTGVITEAKSYDVTLKAEDTHGGTDSYTFTLEVIQPNRAPSITSRTAPTSVNVNETYSYALTATDADGENITYTVEGELSSVLSVENLVNNNGTGTATLTGVITEAKSYDVTLKAEDTHGGTDSYTFTLEVIQPNRAPSITSRTAPTSVNVNETYSYALTATDSDGDNITYSVEGELSSVLSVENLVNNNGTGTATLTGVITEAKSYDVTLKAEDTPRRHR